MLVCQRLNYEILIVRDYVRHNVIMCVTKRHINVNINMHVIIINEM